MNEFMKQKGVWIGVLLVLIIFGIVYSRAQRKADTKIQDTVATATTSVDTRVQGDSGLTLDVRNATYTIGADTLAVVDGTVSSNVSGSSATRKTTVLEGPAFADLTGDNVKDGVVLLRDENGGSGTFYYVAAVLADGSSQKTTNSMLLGDRIRIKEISIDNSIISVTILERAEGESMVTAPSVAKTLRYTVDGQKLVSLQ